MAESIENILKRIGPSLSSVIVAELVKIGITPTAARQRISRARGRVKRLAGVNFPNREKFVFTEGDFGTDDFRDRLVDAFVKTGSAYGRAISGLQARGGSIQCSRFPIATGLPVSLAKGQVPHDFVENTLESLGIIRREDTSIGETLCLYDCHINDAARMALSVVEDTLLSAIREWLVKVGWSSSNALKIRMPGKNPRFGQYEWDLVGPSYLSCLAGFQGKIMKPGFIVGDIVLDRRLSMLDIRSYLSKWDALKVQKNMLSFQPMIIADELETDALQELRKRGAFVCMPSVLFGEDLAKDLRQLKGTVEHAAAAIAKNPEEVFLLLSRVSKVEGASLNLRGVVIEMMIAHLCKLRGDSIDIRKVVYGQSLGKAEIDVLSRNDLEVVCCECKGKAPHVLVDAPEIRDWLDISVPRIKRWLKDQDWLPEKRSFEFYSSSGYTDDALELITETSASHKKQPITFFNGLEIVQKLKDRKQKSLVDIYNEQFLRK